MSLESIESSIAAHLQGAIDASRCTCAVLPEVEAQFTKPVDKAQLHVAIAGLEAGEHRSIGSVVQYTDIRVEVVLKSRRLRGQYGIYHLESLVRNRLLGFRPTGASQGLKYAQFQPNAFTDGVWSYSVFFQCPGTIMEEYEEYTPETPRITSVEFDEEIAQ